VALTYKQIVDQVLADGFAEAKRDKAQGWVQARHAWLWDLEEWTFKQASANIVFTANSQVAGSLPSDFRTAIAVYNTSGAPLQPYEDHVEFYDRYNTRLNLGSGTPEAFTVVAGQLLVGPAGDGSTGLLLYEKGKPTLSADGDPTGLPEGYDLALVHGGKAEGFKLSNVPLWQGFDDDFTAFANAMRRNYLTAVRASTAKQLGAYRPR
jgi:hypothetical protein